MTDMRLKMILDLVSNTKGPAAQAKRDLNGVKDAARDLSRTEAARRITRDILSISSRAKPAARDLLSVKAAATGIGADGSASRMARDLERARASARRLATELRGVKQETLTAFRAKNMAAAGSRAGKEGGTTLFPGTRAMIGGYLGARAVTSSVKKHAEAERAVTRIGVTADASKEALAAVGDTAFKVAQEVAMPYAKVVQGLDVLVAQGRSLKDAMAFLPSVARTASAAGAEVEDIAKTADSVSANFKIAGDQMQTAFDIMATGGKAGQFELKDMARYLPSLGPAAAAAGFTGEKGLSDLVAMLQVMRKGSGTSEEATSSLTNIFQKMESEETSKRFKKFGVDLEAGMAKGRKEGRNLVEVFEDLTATALKGDLSKIPKLFQDQEFARGVRAMMTYRGEWQRLSKTISTTAAGSVVNDLAKVTDNIQARLDTLANSYEKRMRQLGAVISDVVTPIDKKIDEITSGKNATANAINEKAGLYNSDIIAREEMKTGVEGSYDSDTRRRVNARKEYLQREQYENRVGQIDGDIAAKEKILAGRPVRNARIATEQDLVRLRAEREALVSLQKAQDETNLSLAENEATRNRLKTRMSGLPDEQPGPITPGQSSFGFGPQGQSTIRPPLPIETDQGHPEPPRRPDTLPKPAPMLQSLADIYRPADPGDGKRLQKSPLLDLFPQARSGRTGFDLSGPKSSGERWAAQVRETFDIDLGEAGMTLMERFRAGIASGGAGATAAAMGVGSEIRAGLSDIDASGAVAGVMGGMAAAITTNGNAAIAAARVVGQKIKAELTVTGSADVKVGGRRALAGALHDGVD